MAHLQKFTARPTGLNMYDWAYLRARARPEGPSQLCYEDLAHTLSARPKPGKKNTNTNDICGNRPVGMIVNSILAPATKCLELDGESNRRRFCPRIPTRRPPISKVTQLIGNDVLLSKVKD